MFVCLLLHRVVVVVVVVVVAVVAVVVVVAIAARFEELSVRLVPESI